ncbi:hypothetical protein GCM10018772_29860 [Streptomyces fumanus]|uniref:Uncharacterized protein n=1 Tax=Streptomyces fumanus TaxID=67302 RepID=A0A919E256_9ACTN|nr:hypothetical protein GCM10018772_29860 [Streptomyces fumanus]
MIIAPVVQDWPHRDAAEFQVPHCSCAYGGPDPDGIPVLTGGEERRLVQVPGPAGLGVGGAGASDMWSWLSPSTWGNRRTERANDRHEVRGCTKRFETTTSAV